MTIKRILVPLPGAIKQSGEIDLAMSAAKALGAHVEAIYIREPPPAPRGGVSASQFTYANYTNGTAARQINWLAEERERYAREAREHFMQACSLNSITLLGINADTATLPTASWCETKGEYVSVAVRRAAAFDLMIAASATVMDRLKDIAEASLLQTRRPVLLAPSRLETQLTDTAMIAWDESPECWRAVSASVPFLQLAKAVQVVSVDRKTENRTASQAEVLAYLRCHGIAANGRVVAPELRSVGDTLLAAAGEFGIGLLVMGAYSHSRLREMMFGGATRHVLANAAARPVLMAH